MTVGGIRRAVETVREGAARGQDAAHLVRVLTSAVTDHMRETGEWPRDLDEVTALPVGIRTPLADFLLKGHTAGERVSSDAPLAVFAALGKGLPDGRFAKERRRLLDAVGGRHALGFYDRHDALAEAELAETGTLAPAVVAVLRRAALGTYPCKSAVAFAERLTEPALNVGEVWAEQALRDTAGHPAWRALLLHAATAAAARPTAAWERRARALIEPLGADRVRTAVLPWFALVGRRTTALDHPDFGADGESAYDAYNANALRGLAWLLSLLPAHPDSVRALGALVEKSLKKIAGLGPRNPKVANAGVTALSRIDGDAALAEIARLTTRVTYRGTLKLIDAALRSRAEALGLTREEVEELAVPAYGLTGAGRAEHRVGEATAVLGIRDGKAVLAWHNAAGKAVKSVPAAVRRDHPEELKELKAAVKDIDRTLAAQRERLDRQFLARRTWQYATWRARYPDHPLVGTLARRLLWTVDGTTAGYADGELRTLTGDPVTRGAEVRLWHPVEHRPDEIVAWRDWLERHAITQPFKQAHREVYLLTDAERATGTYSNRFAAHVLRQHQFHSLAALRGWRNTLRMWEDGTAPPAVRELPQWGLRAEYWIHGEGSDPETATADHGSAYLRLTTDQVRFYPIDAPENQAHFDGGEYRMWPGAGETPVDPLPLTDVPPLVLSEVLRDVDLFVGVTSIGNDPTWQDGGPAGHLRDYWTSYSFGELDQSAETRRALLERLVPRLAIADRCTLEGRFLAVKGELHTYRIHLGSGNILMTPNDQYLCIVPQRTVATPQTGYVPFEGDRTLAVILSKALLLAKDTEITDPMILSQL